MGLRGFRGTRGQRKIAAFVMATAALATAAGHCEAQPCDSRWSQVQFARDDLQRAASEGDLASAQDFADRARREFNHLATLAGGCGCGPAEAKFDAVASEVRHAQDAESRKELRETIGRAKALFDEAQALLRECRKR
ncbi:MAG: hypothetical protein H6R10_3461 [Rhodocyclaceae bacterium]|nr:hypothetical protein [Rhodocyclaceae bacterium]